jgi:hypothetical protein
MMVNRNGVPTGSLQPPHPIGISFLAGGLHDFNPNYFSLAERKTRFTVLKKF